MLCVCMYVYLYLYGPELQSVLQPVVLLITIIVFSGSQGMCDSLYTVNDRAGYVCMHVYDTFVSLSCMDNMYYMMCGSFR